MQPEDTLHFAADAAASPTKFSEHTRAVNSLTGSNSGFTQPDAPGFHVYHRGACLPSHTKMWKKCFTSGAVTVEARPATACLWVLRAGCAAGTILSITLMGWVRYCTAATTGRNHTYSSTNSLAHILCPPFVRKHSCAGWAGGLPCLSVHVCVSLPNNQLAL